MKNFKILFSFAIFTSLLFTNCSSDNDPSTDDDPGTPCDTYHRDLLTLTTFFDNDPNAIINYNSFLINNLNITLPNPEGLLNTTTNLTFELPTSSSFYNEANNLHGIYVNRTGKYFTFNTTTSTGQEYTTPTNISAPVELGTSSYVIEVSNSGYANSGVGNHFSINTFNINDGMILSTLPLTTASTTFNNNSFFNVESMSSATNGIDELYFLSGTNLITVNTLSNTASHIDLYPLFSITNFARFIGIEYSDSLGLIAIADISSSSTQSLIKINPTTVAYSNLLTIPVYLNTEFYSTTYSECYKTYYLTSMTSGSNTVQTNYFEFNLVTNTVDNTQVFNDYVYGIELIP